MDSNSILGGDCPQRQQPQQEDEPGLSSRHAICPNARRRNRIRNGPIPISTGSPASQIGQISGRQERPKY